MTEQYKKLKSILAEMFQLDQPDLDFGIYRIMNQKRDEVTDFLDNRLLKQVKETLSQAAGADKNKLKKELEEKEKTLRELGVDPEANEKVQELKREYQQAASPAAMENEVYSHLTNFFRRYYHQGDFISQRRYKEGVYAIPYEGEEVKLHWANHDQYYIKTSEYFKNYRFDLPNGKKVNFELLEASTEQNNNKAQNNKERRFKLAEETIFEEEGAQLNIYFSYEPTDKKQKQDDLMAAAFETLKKQLPQAWLQELLRPKPTEKNKNRTLLEKHLKDYTARNTFDYFIHKDLGGFLRRELDFYIKNEILHLDDINLDSEQDFKKQLLLIKALKGVAQKIIVFLAQLEDFQKKLWLKKKFVLQSDYCITLDRIDESFYADIATNEAQRREWVKLFAIDELEDYSEPLTEDFLASNPFLVVDTQFFDRNWKYKLLGTLDRIDQQTDGLLVNSENFQALRLIENRYRQQVRYIYIDPPYNTNSTPILYKNEYKHSSWITLMDNRSEAAKAFLSDQGVKSVAIDDTELDELSMMLDNRFENYRHSKVSVIHNPKGSITRDFNRVHEYVVFLTPLEGDGYVARKLEKNKTPRKMRRWGENSLRTDRKLSFYPIYIKANKIVRVGEVPDDAFHPESRNLQEQNGEIAIYPIDQNGIERRWNFGLDSIDGNLERVTIQEVDNTFDLFVTHELTVPKTVWSGGRFDAGKYGNTLLIDIIGRKQFDFPKSINLVQECCHLVTINNPKAIVLDYFSGSGTTGHAVINLNRETDGKRKYILVEMGEYFNTVTKPRIQRVIYSEDWKNGKPVSRKGSSHCFKYLRLESYEDTLNNLQLKRSEPQAQLLGNENFEEEYHLHYMLEVESRESLLSVDTFKSPFGYSVKSIEHNEIKEVEVDLVETFNYLIGLVVDSIQVIKDYVVVIGDNLSGEHIAVIWRDVEKQDDQALNEFFRKTQIKPRDTEFDRIYVNGDNNLENLKTAEDKWKVMLIEEEFRKRMFDEKTI